MLPGWLGLEQSALDVSPWEIATSVLIFLGIPLLAGYLSRRIGEKRWGRESYERGFLPKVGPWALYGLLFTIVILFALQGEQITNRPMDVARIALPLLVYFALMWGVSYVLGRVLGMGYERTTTLAFTAAGNNFELAIAVAIATFGVTSGQALAGVVGPLIEVPVLVGLVYVSLWLRRRFPHAVVLQFDPQGDRAVVGESYQRLRGLALADRATDRYEVRIRHTDPVFGHFDHGPLLCAACLCRRTRGERDRELLPALLFLGQPATCSAAGTQAARQLQSLGLSSRMIVSFRFALNGVLGFPRATPGNRG